MSNNETERNPITSVTFEETLADVCVEDIESHYGDLFGTLGIKVGFAQFLRILIARQKSSPISNEDMVQILPNTFTNESLRVFLQETKK